MKVLLVEDSHVLQRSLSAGLRNSGYVVDQAFDGVEGLSFATQSSYDAIVLDIMLPKLNGLDLLKRIRADGIGCNVLILSAADQVEDRVRGLDLGADDYLIKPFSFEELISRLRALSRRTSNQALPLDPIISVNKVTLNTNNRTTTVGDEELILTPSEYRILELLCSRRGQTFSHDHLIDRLYNSDQSVTRNAVEAHISSLRKKLKSAGIDEFVTTRRGFGYFVA